jgi:hypothetical protein
MTTISAAYRRPLLDPGDALFLRCLTGSAIAAVLFVVCVRLLPTPPPRPSHRWNSCRSGSRS